MSGWDNTWIRLISVPGFELLTLDVMRDDQIWIRRQVAADKFEDAWAEIREVIEGYWDAICDSNSEVQA